MKHAMFFAQYIRKKIFSHKDCNQNRNKINKEANIVYASEYMITMKIVIILILKLIFLNISI